MGNYMETCIQGEQEKPQQQQQQGEEQEKQESGGGGISYGRESGRMRVKLVLTKDELEWLLLQLKKKEGQKMEDVLGEIEKSRIRMGGKSVAGWKPSLESIMESPEVVHQMDRSS